MKQSTRVVVALVFSVAFLLLGDESAFASGSVPFWIPDNRNRLVRYIDSNGIISTPDITSTDPIWIANSGYHGSLGFSLPWSVALNSSGSILYVVDQGAKVVWAVDTSAFIARRLAGGGSGPG